MKLNIGLNIFCLVYLTILAWMKKSPVLLAFKFSVKVPLKSITNRFKSDNLRLAGRKGKTRFTLYHFRNCKGILFWHFYMHFHWALCLRRQKRPRIRSQTVNSLCDQALWSQSCDLCSPHLIQTANLFDFLCAKTAPEHSLCKRKLTSKFQIR